jgi:hypothetical protein
MLVYISHQKAVAIKKKEGIDKLPKDGEVLIGKLGSKLGNHYNDLSDKCYYVKVYRIEHLNEFNIKY